MVEVVCEKSSTRSNLVRARHIEVLRGQRRISHSEHRPLAARTSRSRDVLTWPSARSSFASLARHSGDFGHETAIAQRLIQVEGQANVVSGRLIEPGARQCTAGALSALVVRAEREECRLRRE